MPRPNVRQPYRYEYVSPVIWMDPSASTEWTLDFSLANRGESWELFKVLITEFDFEPEQPTEVDPGWKVPPGSAFVVNWAFELFNPDDYQGWWARIYTSSRNVVPSIHFYAQPPIPEFYFSPGDFAVFELETGIVPPVVGPVKQ